MYLGSAYLTIYYYILFRHKSLQILHKNVKKVTKICTLEVEVHSFYLGFDLTTVLYPETILKTDSK